MVIFNTINDLNGEPRKVATPAYLYSETVRMLLIRATSTRPMTGLFFVNCNNLPKLLLFLLITGHLVFVDEQ